jgi:hypothetical protein
MTNSSNLGSNPQFSILEFARSNSPRGSILSAKAIWTDTVSAPLILQPPQNISNGEMFFVKEINLLIKKGTDLGNNKFQIFHNNNYPSILVEASSTIEIFTYFDVHPASPIQDPQFPTDVNEQWDKLVLELPTPLKIRSTNSDRFEIRLTDSVNVSVLTGLPSGEIQASVLGWRIIEATY